MSAAPHPKQRLSDLNLYFKKDRQITHNSMFADYLCPSMDFSIRNPRPNCQRSTILSGTRQYSILVINPTKIGLSQAEGRNPTPCKGSGRFCGSSQIRGYP